MRGDFFFAGCFCIFRHYKSTEYENKIGVKITRLTVEKNEKKRNHRFGFILFDVEDKDVSIRIV